MAREDPSDGRPAKRPLGVTLFSLAMAWLTFAGLANSATMFLVNDSPFPGYFSIFTLAYAVTAAATTVGLWRMKSWTLTAFRAWMASCTIFMVAFGIFFRIDQILPEVWPGLLSFTAFALVVFWLLDRYIRSRLPTAS